LEKKGSKGKKGLDSSNNFLVPQTNVFQNPIAYHENREKPFWADKGFLFEQVFTPTQLLIKIKRKKNKKRSKESS